MPKRSSAARATDAAAARAEVFGALHQEMELAEYATGTTGQKVKVVPKNQKAARTAKRRALQESDRREMAIEAEDGYEEGADARRKRLRGSTAAFDDAVLKSMPLSHTNRGKAEFVDGSRDNDQNEKDEMLQEVAALGIELGPDGVDKFDEYEEGDDEEEEEDDEEEECDGEDERQIQTGTSRAVSEGGLIKPQTTKRLMHRLRDFTSQKLAKKHGEAIDAHIRGMSETAVQKLREVAKLAPGAPQVYSSLGMVFESMLREVEEGKPSEKREDIGEKAKLSLLQHRLELAQKAYASYHVASLLCKRDFVLWERSGDAAARAAQIYSEIIEHMTKHGMSGRSISIKATLDVGEESRKGFDLNDGPEKCRSEHKIWLEHALSAYQASDNLRPPGVDIPCKLAQMHTELGNYMEALSILTDLRNVASGKVVNDKNGQENKLGRSEMEASYPCWLLYADLMMKIGYECKQFNDEVVDTDQSNTFRRWLSKNSKKFDWKERRLQALCLALEAAAGSVSCSKMIEWMRDRAEKHPCMLINVNDDDGDDGADGGHENGNKASAEVTKNAYEKEREDLINLNKVQLKNFDKVTKEMNLIAGSHIAKNRVAQRAAVVEKHRTAMRDLAMQNCSGEEQNDEANGATNETPKPLPLQGSFAAVYDISVLLLRQCIQLRLFEGGLLAVQSVLNYSNERITLHDKKTAMRRENRVLQESGQGVVQSGFKYDQINFNSDDSDSEGAYLSDEDDLDEPGATQSVKGRLPDDIRCLHAICLLGAGGKDYIALQHVEQFLLANKLDLFVENDTAHVANISSDPQWLAFSLYYTAPINKSFLLASVADLTMENAKGCYQPHRLLDIFRKHVFKLINNNQGLDMDQALTGSNQLHRSQALQILLASIKLLVNCARTDLAALDVKGGKVVEDALATTTYAVKIMARFVNVLWRPQFSDWSLPQPSINMMSILSEAVAILVQTASSVDTDSLLNSLIKPQFLISKICQADDALSLASGNADVESWQSFPLPCNWQTSFHKKISLRAYNLCVACCVSSFSGWEPAEFNLHQLQCSEINFFGVSIEGSSAAGFLPSNASSMIAEQWDLVHALLPELEALRFETLLDERKKMGWYQKVVRSIEKQSIDRSKLSMYGEEDGVRALLSFSKLCLVAAKECEGDKRNSYVMLATSILLPMTQFSVNKQVWQSTLGSAVISGKNETKIGYYLDGDCQWMGPRKQTQPRVTSKTTQRMQPRPTKTVRPTRTRAPSNVIRVPASILMQEWRRDDTSKDKMHASEGAQKAMKTVDDAMKNLRKSRTLNSLEKASIDVAVALLSLVALDECNDPFVCLQQAAMFAAMGSKRGNNDEPFKRFLPLKKSCTPVQALDVLGRADCLRAVHFLHEAQYLCNWVASVCRSHRNRLQPEMPWSPRWKVVSIQAYIVSATIDETGEALSYDDPNAGALRKWEQDAIDEINRGGADAISLSSMITGLAPPLTAHEHAQNSLAPDRSEYNETNGHVESSHDNNIETFLYEEMKVPQMEEMPMEVEEDDPFAQVEVVGV